VTLTLNCARCTVIYHVWDRLCPGCGLPFGVASADLAAGRDALEPYEAPQPGDPDLRRAASDFARASGLPYSPSGSGWCLEVPIRGDRKQAVYVGPQGTDRDGRPLLGLISVCGPASARDERTLLRFNARAIEGHFAIKQLRGEEYFVVCRAVAIEDASRLEPARLVRRIAETADGFEDRLSRGADLY
jgi:hypothetical protein